MPRENKKDKEVSSEWGWAWSDDDSELGSTFDTKEAAMEDATESMEDQDSDDEQEIIVYELVPRCKLTRVPGVKVTKL